MTTIIISAAQTIIVSMLIFYLQHKQNKKEKKVEERAEARKEESLLLLKMVNAGNALSFACAMALKRGKANGEVEEATKVYNSAKQDYYDLINEAAKEHLNE